MPMPVSETDTVISSLSLRSTTVISPPAGVKRMALEMRLDQMCSISSSLP